MGKKKTATGRKKTAWGRKKTAFGRKKTGSRFWFFWPGKSPRRAWYDHGRVAGEGFVPHASLPSLANLGWWGAVGGVGLGQHASYRATARGLAGPWSRGPLPQATCEAAGCGRRRACVGASQAPSRREKFDASSSGFLNTLRRGYCTTQPLLWIQMLATFLLLRPFSRQQRLYLL